MAESRHLSEEPGVDFLGIREPLDRTLGVDEQLRGRDVGRERRLDEVFALTDEEAEAFTLLSGGEPPDEPEPGIRSGGDQTGSPSHSSHWP